MSINRTPSSNVLNPGRIMDSHVRNDSSEKSSKSLASNRSLFGKGQGAIFSKSNKAAIRSFREKLFNEDLDEPKKLNQFTNLMLYSNHNRNLNAANNGIGQGDQRILLSDQAREQLRIFKN